MLDVNVTGAMRICRAALRHFAPEGGTIVLVASAAGLRPLADRTAYCASKAALIMFAKTLAAELAPQRVRVNALCPGAVETALFRTSFADAPDEEAARERDSRALCLAPHRRSGRNRAEHPVSVERGVELCDRRRARRRRRTELPLNLRRFEGDVAMVTGAANGIGAAIARRLADEGARIAIIDLEEAALTRTFADLPAASCLIRAGDCTDDAVLRRFVAETEERLGPIDALVNNVGQSARERGGPFIESQRGSLALRSRNLAADDIAPDAGSSRRR